MGQKIIRLDQITSAEGFKIAAPEAGGSFGVSLAGVGDINGDGVADLVVGANFSDEGALRGGSVYVLFGGPGLSGVDLAALGAGEGVKIVSTETRAQTGISVATGDVNGDRHDDILVGGYNSVDGNRAFVYVVYGGPDGPGVTRFADITPATGAVISPTGSTGGFGDSVALADLNNDGYADAVIGDLASGATSFLGGGVWVVYGGPAGIPDVNVGTMAAGEGFRILPEASVDLLGASASAGDVNGDGLDDIIMGAQGNDEGGSSFGAAYVIYGTTGGPGDIDLAALTPSQGFKIIGSGGGALGTAGAGDVNGDGVDDMMIGALNANSVYVIYGEAGGRSDLTLSTLTAGQGFKISGVSGENVGSFMTAAGDVNGDGYGDVIIGGGSNDENATNAGAAYVVYGGAGLVDVSLSTMTSAQGFKISGVWNQGNAGESVTGLGDINGDGFDDIAIGEPGNPEIASLTGAAYVIYGFDSNTAPEISVGAASATLAEDGTASATASVDILDVDGDTPVIDAAAMTADGWIETSPGVWEKAGTYGTAVFSLAGGVVAYTLANASAAVQSLGASDVETEDFTVHVGDGTLTGTGTATFTIEGANDAPTVTIRRRWSRTARRARRRASLPKTPTATPPRSTPWR